MKKTCHINILLAVLFIIAGCAQETDFPFPEPVPVSRNPISWNIEQVQTRALINDNSLCDACKVKADGTNESIGVWGQYTISLENQDQTFQEFTATPLMYGTKEGEENIPDYWFYQGELRYWMTPSVYDFRACYPLKLMTSLMTQMDATIIQGGPINTSVLQEDILVAAIRVDTRTANLLEAVPLDMKHIFAAVKFKVKAVDGFMPASGEGVTSCWLQNKNNATNLFSPSGYLVHSGNASPDITWHPYESSAAPMYMWKHQGVSFNEENTLYTPNDGMDGEQYTHNDGWLLIVPQTVKEETLQFCYTLKNAGNQVFAVNIPPITYEHGKKYTYVLEIRGSETELKLSIAPWNHLESSYDITI